MTSAMDGPAALAARAFVARHGGALARARLDLPGGVAASGDVLRELSARARTPDGYAWGDDAAEPASVPGTLAALDVLDEAGMKSGPEIERALRHLARTQAADGSWRDGAEDEGVVATGLVLARLARLRGASPRSLARADAFLSGAFSPERVEQGGWEAVAAFAAPAANGALECADEALQWCGRSLEKGVRGGAIPVLDAARVLLLCDAPSLPGARLSAAELLLALPGEQADDGGFGAPDASTPERVEATLLALRAFRRFGAASR